MGEWMYRSTFSWPRHKLEFRGQLHALAALPRGKEPLYPLNRKLSGPEWAWRREEKILDHTGTRTLTSRSSSPEPVAIPTTLSRLPCITVNEDVKYGTCYIVMMWGCLNLLEAREEITRRILHNSGLCCNYDGAQAIIIALDVPTTAL
jgi:hypothetical protein